MASNDSWVGKTLGDCRLEKLIGEGAMGGVYMATHLKWGKKVAVKLMHSNYLVGEKGERYKKRFKREAKWASKLDHPNIIKIYYMGEEKGVLYIVMEYLEGKTLFDMIVEEKQLSVPLLLPIIKNIVEALDLAHKNNIVHRDIKPGNIIILKNGVVKLTDFGLARATDMMSSISQTGQIIGTIFYMSPEQARGKQNIDHRADFYSLGITMYQCLTGQLPYPGRTPIQVIQQHISAPIPSVKEIAPGVDSRIDQIIQKLMRKKPSQRFSHAKQILEKLNMIDSRTVKRHDRFKILKFTSVSLCVLLLCIFLGIYFGKSQKKIPQEVYQLIQNKQYDKAKNVLKRIGFKDRDIYRLFPKYFKKQANKKFPVHFEKVQPSYNAEVRKESVSISGKVRCEMLAFVKVAQEKVLCKKIGKNLFSFSKVIKLKKGENIFSIHAVDSSGNIIGKHKMLLNYIPVINTFSETVARIEIFPREVYLAPGESVKFHIKGYNPWNKEVSFKAHWISSGGKLKGNVYTAGKRYGDYVILVRDRHTWIQAQSVVHIRNYSKGWFNEKLSSNITISSHIGEYIWKKDQSVMVYVPKGYFWLGDNRGSEDEKPVRKMKLKSYYIDKYEVSWNKYLAFCKKTGFKEPPKPRWKIAPNHPVVNVSWNDASHYARWLNKRLPSEAQWEKAAKGGIRIPNWRKQTTPVTGFLNTYPRRKYPWGNKIIIKNRFFCNYTAYDNWKYRKEDGYTFTAPVGSFPQGRSPYNCMDMAGNVWEWCLDSYESDFYKKRKRSQKVNISDSSKNVIRGGSWYNFSDSCRTSKRHYAQSDDRFPWIGIRLAK